MDGSQLHHPPGPRHQPAYHAPAHLLLPHGHRGGRASRPPADPQLLSPGAPRPRPEPSSPRPGCASGVARRAPRAAEPLGAAEGLTPPLPQRRSRPERFPARPEAVTPLPCPMSTPSLPRTAEELSRSLSSPVSTPTLLRAADGRSRPLGAGGACLPGRRPIPRQAGGWTSSRFLCALGTEHPQLRPAWLRGLWLGWPSPRCPLNTFILSRPFLKGWRW